MILNLFRRDASDAIVERLYVQIVAASRRTAFFLPPIDVPDTLAGRFEILTLHAFLVLKRLSALPAPAPDLAQDLADRIFRGFDEALREMGVGDLTVPKRIKRMAEEFGGRNKAYANATSGGEPLEAALARNVFEDADPARGNALARWTRAAERVLAGAGLSDFETGLPVLPEPSIPLENAR